MLGLLAALVLCGAGVAQEADAFGVGEGWEEVELFRLQEAGSYYRGGMTISPGDGNVVLEVEASKAADSAGGQPGGWWHYVEFYRGGQYITGKYVSPEVAGEVQTFDVCRSYVPDMATHIQFGIGKSEESAGFFTIRSARLLLRRPTVALVSPDDGAALEMGMPRLAWKSEGFRFTVELCMNEDFEPEQTRRWNLLNRKAFTVPEILSEGTWYWRIRTADGFVSPTRSFVVHNPSLTPLRGEAAMPAEDTLVGDPGCQQPVVRWTKSRGILIGNPPEPFYPMAMYMVRETEMAKVKAAGFNLIQHYAADGGSNEDTAQWLDAAHRHGLKAFISFDRKKLGDMDLDYVTTRVKALRDHPALLAWYLFDEPELAHPPHYGVAPFKLEAVYERIKRLDGSHPVLLTCYNERLIPDYIDCFDVYMTQAYHNDAASVARETLFTHQLLQNYPTKSGVVIVNNKIPFAAHAQVRAGAVIAMMFQSGLVWWGWWDDYFMGRFAARKQTFHQRFADIDTTEGKRDAFQAELAALNTEFAILIPIFTAAGTVERVVRDDVYGYIKRSPEQTRVVLVCLADEPVHLSQPLQGVSALKPLLPADGPVLNLPQGILELTMNPGEVRAFTSMPD